MNKNDDFTIRIISKGEELVYKEDEREYWREVFLGKQPLILYAYSYHDGTRPYINKFLTTEEKERIIPRIIDFLGQKGELVKVEWEQRPYPNVLLKTSWEIFLERRKLRGIPES